ncbi:MFS transporter [Phyllobacterium sp. 22229]|uniref:MFS transporter n=1 Tax=Phyllobacterium myrsinacearum TaxID=28101 RepID=A0A2S9JA08_9HYPH|nr:MFS transporter [Phyllobacterium myrsinacearum]PRD49612.1 MFS transporter [Phyllobacterium myrsinacearum]PWV94808.1 MHS family proline/betaine transporter-like MFS transporter [Phyllobacterium myrsinacearum]RZV07081.1 MHS family proline/betaine transporter-like MFS transporter [Phyllobacterium myrsinacearum]
MTVQASPLTSDYDAKRRHAIAAATIGNGLEWFDFTVYGFFTPIIARLFFPAINDLTSILLTVGTYGVGFFMRPVGAVVLGVYADRKGRKAALTLTILMMAFGTALLGFAPTYAQAGIIGPLVIVLARLIQGFSAGGEIGGATAFLIEYAPPEKRGFYASWQQTSQALAVVLGGICGTIVTHALDPAAIDSWGWRVPFLLGLLIGPVGFYIRARVDETPVFTDSHTQKSESPLRDALRDHPRGIASGFGVTILWTVCTYVLLFYMTTYAVKQLNIPLADAFVATTIGGLVLMLGCPVAGALSDRVGRKRLLLAAAIAIGVLIYPLFAWVNASPDLMTLAIVQGILGLLLAAFTGPAPALLAEQFPAGLRSTGLSLAYNFAVTIFGGFAAVIVTLLIEATGTKLAPSFYVMAAALVSALTLLTMQDKTGKPID